MGGWQNAKRFAIRGRAEMNSQDHSARSVDHLTTRRTVSAALLLVVALSGCAGTTAPITSQPSTTTAISTTTTPSVATENEVASIIAGGEKTWREAADKSPECRLAFVLKEKGVAAGVERVTCYTNELTAGVKAEIAIRDLRALNIPPSMQGLVTETQSALQMMVDADLENACGPAMTEPKDTKECTSALGTPNWSYTLMTSVLDKWSPYL
jgi:hypothetical protein